MPKELRMTVEVAVPVDGKDAFKQTAVVEEMRLAAQTLINVAVACGGAGNTLSASIVTIRGKQAEMAIAARPHLLGVASIKIEGQPDPDSCVTYGPERARDIPPPAVDKSEPPFDPKHIHLSNVPPASAGSGDDLDIPPEFRRP